MKMISPGVFATPENVVALDRLGDEIAELSAHLEAATSRLLDLIREFDARGGWNNGFRSPAGQLAGRAAECRLGDRRPAPSGRRAPLLDLRTRERE